MATASDAAQPSPLSTNAARDGELDPVAGKSFKQDRRRVQLDSRKLTVWITQQHNVPALVSLVRRSAAHLDHIHAAAALSTLSRIAPGSNLTADDLQTECHALFDTLLPFISDFSPQELAACVLACGKVQVKGHDLPEALLSAATHNLHLFSTHDVVKVVWAAGRLGCRIRVEEFVSSVESMLEDHLEDLKQHEMLMLLGGLAKLGAKPGEVWQERAHEASMQLLQDCGPFELANLAWSLATLNAAPGSAWMNLFLEESGRKLEFFRSQELANILWALAKMRQHVPHEWLLSWHHISLPLLPEFRPQELTMALWAASIHGAPPHDWVQAAAHTFMSRLHQLDSRPLIMCFWSLARAEYEFEAAELNVVCKELQPRLALLSARDLFTTTAALVLVGEVECVHITAVKSGIASSLEQLLLDDAVPAHLLCPLCWSTARLGCELSPTLLSALLSACDQHVVHMGSTDIAKLCWSMATLRHPEGVVWSYRSSLDKMGSMNAADFAMLLWGLASASHHPPPSWLATFESTSLLLLVNCHPKSLCTIIWSLSSLRLPPSSTWLNEFTISTGLQLSLFPPHMPIVVLAALHKLNHPPPRVWRYYVFSALQPELSGSSPFLLARCISVFAMIGWRPEWPWMDSFWDASSAQMVNMSIKDLGRVLWALGRLYRQPPDTWWRAFWHWSLPCLSEASGGVLVQLVYGHARLGTPPPTEWTAAWRQQYDAVQADLTASERCTLEWAAAELQIKA